MASLKQPKLKKYPKRPKANAKSDTVKNWLSKVAGIDKENKKAQSDYLKEKKARETLRNKVKKVGKPSDKVKR